jgi:choline monooxygenase
MNDTLEGALGAEALARFADANGTIRGLPAAAYTSEAFLQLEKEKLFTKTWTFVGFTHELTQSGDAVPVQVAGRPVLLLCGADGEIRAFHNVCRHRCLALVDEPGNVGRLLRCPYHSWTYGLDGKLKGAPHFGGPNRHEPPALDGGADGLAPVRIAVWHDWIFVNLSGTAPDFETAVAPLARNLEGVDFGRLTPVATLDFGEVETNWKLLMENFIEPYHVQFVHPTTTTQPLTDHSTLVDETCIGSAVDISRQPGVGAEGTLAVSSRYLTFFPNFVLGLYFPDQVGVHLNTPTAAGRTHQRRAIYHAGEEEMPAEEVEGLRRLWRDVHGEDHAMCVRLQKGRASQVAEAGGVLSPHWETSVRRFQELVLDSLA